MELPIGTAVVEASTPKTLVLRHPTLQLTMCGPTYSAFRERLVALGWSVDSEDTYDEGTKDVQVVGKLKKGTDSLRLTVERSRAGGVEISMMR
jgi:hypothetical protein